MKAFFLSLIFAVVSASANAAIIDVEIEKGNNIVEVSWTFWATGCNGSMTELPVIYSEDLDAYVTGRNIHYTPVDPSELEDLLKRPRPPMICQAEVAHTSIAKFAVMSEFPRTIQVVIPNNQLLGPMEINVETTQNGGLTLE